MLWQWHIPQGPEYITLGNERRIQRTLLFGPYVLRTRALSGLWEGLPGVLPATACAQQYPHKPRETYPNDGSLALPRRVHKRRMTRGKTCKYKGI